MNSTAIRKVKNRLEGFDGMNDSLENIGSLTNKDVPMGASRPSPILSNLQESLSKSQPCCKRVGHSISCDMFLVTILGQMVQRPPPTTESASAHHWSISQCCQGWVNGDH